MDYAKESLRLHGEWKGKIEVVCTVPCKTKDDLVNAVYLMSSSFGGINLEDISALRCFEPMLLY